MADKYTTQWTDHSGWVTTTGYWDTGEQYVESDPARVSPPPPPELTFVEVGALPNDIGYELAVYLTRQFKTYRSRFKTRTVPPAIVQMLIVKFAELQYAPDPED